MRLSPDEIKAFMYADDDVPPLPLEFDDGRMIFGPVFSLSIPVDGRLHPIGPFDFDVTKPGSQRGPAIRLRTIDGREIVRPRRPVDTATP